MMISAHIGFPSALLIFSLLLFGCAGGESGPAAGPPRAPDVFDHKPPRDTIDWSSLLGQGKSPRVAPTKLEWPGEKLGLTGPIIAIGGKGSNRYITVYDPAGVLVGAMTQEEAQAEPTRLEQLIKTAHARGEHQNRHALQFMAMHRLYSDMAAKAGKEAP